MLRRRRADGWSACGSPSRFQTPGDGVPGLLFQAGVNAEPGGGAALSAEYLPVHPAIALFGAE